MVALLNNGPGVEGPARASTSPRVPPPKPKPSALCTQVVLSRQRRQIFNLYWVERLPQTTIAQQLHLPQQTVSYHIIGIRRAYSQAGVQLPDPARTRHARPAAMTRKKYTPPGVVEIDVARLVNMLYQLGKTRSGAVGEGLILGTVLMAIDNDTVQDAIGRLVRPASGGKR
jgi:hypothetical protein